MTFHGVFAPAWADDSRVVEILREEANDQRDWFGTDRDKALLLHAADRIAVLGALLDATRDHFAFHPTYGPEYCGICKARALAEPPVSLDSGESVE